jgi:GxxExxY protein
LKQEERLVLEPSPELDEIAGLVIGAALEVHRILGPGFLESVYEDALAIELALRSVSFERQKPVSVSYKGRRIGEGRSDFLVEDSLIVELKAAERLLPVHHAQVLSYLKATGCRLGLLINFHESQLRQGIRRIVLSPAT